MTQTTIVFSIAAKILPTHLLQVFRWTQNHDPSDTELITTYSKGTITKFEAISRTVENDFLTEQGTFYSTEKGLYWNKTNSEEGFFNRISNTFMESMWDHENKKEIKYKSSFPISISMIFFHKRFTFKVPALALEDFLTEFPEKKKNTFYQNKQICTNCFSPHRLSCLMKEHIDCSISFAKKVV